MVRVLLKSYILKLTKQSIFFVQRILLKIENTNINQKIFFEKSAVTQSDTDHLTDVLCG